MTEISKWINYHHLYYFKTIAEEQSVSKAAEKLMLGQPTLSAQLKLFEESIGAQLFERQHKKLILTEQGKVALDYAKSIFKLGSEMYEVLHDNIQPQRQAVCIASLDSIPKEITLEVVRSVLKISNCQITLIEGHPDELLKELSEHRVDVLITNFLSAASNFKGLSYRSLIKSKISIYGSSEFKNLKRNFPRSIIGKPILLPTYDSKLRYDIEHWCKLKKIDLDILSETQDVAVKKMMAQAGMGLLPVAEHTISKNSLDKSLIEIGKLDGLFEELFIVKAQRKIENPIIQELFKENLKILN